jgi:hypothetical protein
MITARLDKNRHAIEIEYNGHRIEVDSASIEYDGKRRALHLKVFDFRLLADSQCPERHRFELVLRAAGNSEKIAALKPACSLIALNPDGCTGCPDRPL